MNKALDLTEIFDAAVFAAEKHQGAVRKNSQHSPYITHPLLVSKAIYQIGKIEETTILAAAILHDTIEDTKTTRVEIKKRFGENVLSIVLEVTDDKSLPKMTRKGLQILHAPDLSYEARIVKLADKLVNCRDILNDPPEDWSLQRRQNYIQWGADVIYKIRGTNQGLESAFDQVMRSAEEELNYEIEPYSTIHRRMKGSEYLLGTDQVQD